MHFGIANFKTHAPSTVLTPEIERHMLAKTPLARLGQPDDIAYAGGVQELD